MVYVGKRPKKQVTRNITETIIAEMLSSCWRYLSIWFFWTRFESMFYSLTELEEDDENNRTRNEVSSTDPEKDAKNNSICDEVFTVLAFDSSNKGWAIISKGSAETVTADGETILKSFQHLGGGREGKGFLFQHSVVSLSNFILRSTATSSSFLGQMVSSWRRWSAASVGVQWRSTSCSAAAPMKRCS